MPACIAGGIPACLAAGLQGVSPGPHPRGKLKGLARGDLQAHTLLQGGPLQGGSTPEGRPPMTATAGGGTHPTGMHSCHVCVVS